MNNLATLGRTLSSTARDLLEAASRLPANIGLTRLHTRPWSDLLNYWDLTEDGVMILDDGQVEVGVEAIPGPDILRSEDEREALVRKLMGLVDNVLPQGQRLRMIVESRPSSGWEVDAYQSNKSTTDPILRALVDERAAEARRLAAQGERLTWRSFYCMTSGSKRANYKPYNKTAYKRTLENALRLRGVMFDSLAAMGMSPKAMDDQDVFGLCFRFLNDAQTPIPRYRRYRKVHSRESLRKNPGLNPPTTRVQLAQSEYFNLSRHFGDIGRDTFRVFQMNGHPTRTYWQMLSSILACERGFLVVDVHHRVQVETDETLERERDRTAKFMDSGVRLSSIANANRDLSAALDRKNDTGEHYHDVAVSLVLFSESDQRLEAIEQRLLDASLTIPGFFFRRLEDYTAIPYSQLLPFSGRMADFTRPILSTNVAHMICTEGPWARRVETATTLLSNRYNALVPIQMFDPMTTNWNKSVVGVSGSGKTMSLQYLVTDILAEGNTQVVIVDKKKDFLNLCTLLGGAFIDVAPSSSTPVNMFDLAEGATEPGLVKLANIERFYRIMNHREEDPDGALKLQLFREAVRVAYSTSRLTDILLGQNLVSFKQFNLGYVADIAETLETIEGMSSSLNPQQRGVAKMLALELREWVNGPVGPFLNPPMNPQNPAAPLSSAKIEDNPFVYIDIGGFDALQNPKVEALVMSILGQVVYERLENIPLAVRKVIVWDEFHAMMKIPQAAELALDLKKRVRSLNGAVIDATQSVDDYASTIGQKLIDSTSDFLVLKCSEQEHKVQKVYGLPESIVPDLRSIERRKGQYTEGLYFIKAEDNRKYGEVVRFVLSPFDYWLFTSDPNDKAKRNQLVVKNGGRFIGNQIASDPASKEALVKAVRQLGRPG